VGTGVIRVVLADDQRVVREGLATLLSLLPGIEVVGAAADGEEAVELVTRTQPDVVLMDLRMPRCDGVTATRLLKESAPAVKVLVLTTYADDRSVIDALRSGARGYLTKDAGADELQRAIEQVAGGQAVIDPAVQHHVVDALAGGRDGDRDGDRDEMAADGPGSGALPDGLTPREAEVLALIAGGLSNAEIANQLYVSETTVKSHINHLFAKTGVRDRAQAVAYAYRHGLAGGRR
jgi:DNA-binding NarL/FixJ family response regulator